MTNHNVLYIVEGKTEKDLLKRLWDRFEPNSGYSVYIYNTNVHVLTNHLFENGALDEDLDVVRVLRSDVKSDSEKEILGKKFEYVYMIFDFDPQDSNFDPEKIAQMMDFFNDPADNGRLYLNYPMMESYRHMKSLDDEEFKERKTTIEILKNGTYKELVQNESGKELKQINNYTKNTFMTLIKLHLKKKNYILDGAYELMSKEVFFQQTGSELLKKQMESLKKDGSIFVINTCIFNIVEYMPSLFFNE